MSLRGYLAFEPLLHKPLYLKAMARNSGSGLTYGYAENEPILKSDPTGLFVTGTACGGYSRAARIAWKRAGCEKEKCNDKDSCRNQLLRRGVCDICPILSDGEGPLLSFVQWLTRARPGARATAEKASYGDLKIEWLRIRNSFCEEGMESDLASLLIHEAMHFCNGNQNPGDPYASYLNGNLCGSTLSNEAP
jgi:hypothetical protein